MSMSKDFQYRDKIPVAILGATGTVGQRFIELLEHHPWFEIVALAASERSAGKTYREAVNWLMATPLLKEIGDTKVLPCEPGIPGVIAFSALDSSVAGEVEKNFAEAGYIVVSNASSYRMDPLVPLLIPEINAEHLELLKEQKYGKGKIVTNPNCSTIGLALALKPISDKFGIESVNVVTMQAISGAGYPGVASLDILDNVIPYIKSEEEKVEIEPRKILGLYEKGAIKLSDIKISAHCNRVPVNDGHMASVSVKLKSKATEQELIDVWLSFTSEAQELELPLAPKRPVHYFHQHNFPQPKLHRNHDKGMCVTIGRLRPCPILDYKFTVLSHNTIRGAAGGAILCAEMMVKKGHIFW